jgi:Putative mono-oxygenase ydhR
MKTAEALLSVKFTTSLRLEELNELCQADLEYFRSVRGLIQKYYIVDSSTKTVNGIYLFESKTSRASYWASKLARSMPKRYGLVPGTLRVENFDVMIVLNEGVTA